MTVNDNLEYSRQRKMHKVCLQANNSFSHLFRILPLWHPLKLLYDMQINTFYCVKYPITGPSIVDRVN